MELRTEKAEINQLLEDSYESLEIFDETAELLINNNETEIIVRKIIALHHKLQSLYELSLINRFEMLSLFESELKDTK